MNLQHEIDQARSEIITDGYKMSIGEWISLYEHNEIDIHPELQSHFRWSDYQKSRLIESILLGIPISPIFVAQRSDGIWDVVDGLQRLSTIYQLAGILKDQDDNLIEPFTLRATKYFPSLEGMRWNDPEFQKNSLDANQRLLIKRAKMDVSIILKQDDDNYRYELFDQLNRDDLSLSEQQVRNNLLIMANPELYNWIKFLSENEDFIECTSLTDRSLDEQYDMALVLRFILLRTIPVEQLTDIVDVERFLTEQIMKIAHMEQHIDRIEEEQIFNQTFSMLKRHLGDDSFRKFDIHRNRFVGGFLTSVFEAVALGVGNNYQQLIDADIDIRQIVIDLWTCSTPESNLDSRYCASQNVLIPISIGWSAFRI